MGFRFSLATVLRVREIIERREERALQKIQAEIAQVARQVAEIGAAIAAAQQAREQALRQAMPAGQLHTMLWEVGTALQKQQALQQQLAALEQQKEQQLKIYQNAHRDREMLTDMCDRHRDEYQAEQTRAQQKQLDDIFAARHHRS
jgi:flagellar export protein FliJ